MCNNNISKEQMAVFEEDFKGDFIDLENSRVCLTQRTLNSGVSITSEKAIEFVFQAVEDLKGKIKNFRFTDDGGVELEFKNLSELIAMADEAEEEGVVVLTHEAELKAHFGSGYDDKTKLMNAVLKDAISYLFPRQNVAIPLMPAKLSK